MHRHVPALLSTLTALALVLTAHAEPPAQPEPPAPEARPMEAAAPDLAKGKTIFGSYCQACHGADGKGNSGLAANFVDDQARLAAPDAALLKVIADGKNGDTGIMPPWGAVLNEADRVAVLAYIRATFGAPAEP